MKNYPLVSPKQVSSEPDTRYLFFEELKHNRPEAIIRLKTRITPIMRMLFPGNNLLREDFEEILNDAVLICLKKIQNGSCQFKNCDPATYTVGIARRLIANHRRKSSSYYECLQEHHRITVADPHHLLELEERKRLINESLSLLGNTGAQVIRLYYLEGLRDEEVVRQKLTPYTTVNSLKTKRSRYIKKLASVIYPSGFWY